MLFKGFVLPAAKLAGGPMLWEDTNVWDRDSSYNQVYHAGEGLGRSFTQRWPDSSLSSFATDHFGDSPYSEWPGVDYTEYGLFKD